jgi:hypothetical protein
VRRVVYSFLIQIVGGSALGGSHDGSKLVGSGLSCYIPSSLYIGVHNDYSHDYSAIVCMLSHMCLLVAMTCCVHRSLDANREWSLSCFLRVVIFLVLCLFHF